MKLTMREKIMLIVLGLFVLLAADYYFIIRPQMEKLALSIAKQIETKAEVESVKREIAPGNPIYENLKEVEGKVGDVSVRFYPEIVQEKIILIMEDLFEKTRLESNSNSYSAMTVGSVEVVSYQDTVASDIRKLVEDYYILTDEGSRDSGTQNTGSDKNTAADNGANALTGSVETMTVNVQYNASYTQLMNFIKEIEALDKTILIKNLSVNAAGEGGDEGKLSGSMQVVFHALPKVVEQDEEYYEWPYSGRYGTSNPFIQKP